MPKELVEENFNAMLLSMSAIAPVSPDLEIKLRIAFQEGVIKTYVAKIGA